MELRKFFLKLMLWSLGFAAITGVIAILSQGGTLVLRLVGTGLVTAGAAALLIAFSTMVDHQKTRAAGLLGMGLVVLEYGLILLLIWQVIRNLLGSPVEDKLALSLVLTGVLALVAVVLLSVHSFERTLWFSRVGLLLTLVVLILILTAIWLPGGPNNTDRWWRSAGAVSVYGLLALLSVISIGSAKQRWWRWLGIAASVVAAALWLHDIWIGRGSDLGFVTFVTLTSAGWVTGHANIAILCPLTPNQRWLLWTTIACAILAAALLDWLFIDQKFVHSGPAFEEQLMRFVGAAGILFGCGSLALCVLARLNRRVAFEPTILEMVQILLACPRCGKKQKVNIGDAHCVACNLRIQTRIEEPRCPKCEYLLYRLTSDRCPECGTLITRGS